MPRTPLLNNLIVPIGGVVPYLGNSANFALSPQASEFLMLDGKSIGDATSGATARANADTYSLYLIVWQTCANADAPVSGGRGSDALSDFNAHKTLTLPDPRGLGLSVAGTNGLSQTANSNFFVRTIGHREDDMGQSHAHPIFTDIGGATQMQYVGNGGASNSPNTLAQGVSPTNTLLPYPAIASEGMGTPRKGLETRMANVAFNLIIRFK